MKSILCFFFFLLSFEKKKSFREISPYLIFHNWKFRIFSRDSARLSCDSSSKFQGYLSLSGEHGGSESRKREENDEIDFFLSL